MSLHNSFDSLKTFNLGNGSEGQFYSLPALETAGLGQISRLPVCMRIVLEAVPVLLRPVHLRLHPSTDRKTRVRARSIVLIRD